MFKDSSWQDLATQATGSKIQVTGEKIQNIKVEEAGKYEVYTDVSEV